ncbi:hypothetical protein [Glutamicibacter sp.]|uniref:hypothetical protein n=1 Tax=Glutamicibacter sp. TaxID=1931995 RepID=UPI0028BD7C2F|nr:hypothetical protein [Glutamicibacter sp.]
MNIVLPTDCGNAPRTTIVTDFTVGWAQRDTDQINTWLSDDTRWTVIGPEASREVITAAPSFPGSTGTALEVTSIITHGRFASCDGFLDTGCGRLHFSHVFTFSSAAKTAKIKQARTYLILLPR